MRARRFGEYAIRVLSCTCKRLSRSIRLEERRIATRPFMQLVVYDPRNPYGYWLLGLWHAASFEVDLAGKGATLGVPEGFTLPDAADKEQSVGAGGEA